MTDTIAMVLVFVIVLVGLVVAGYFRYKRWQEVDEIIACLNGNKDSLKATDIISSACMYYRHDFGLLEGAEREHTIFEAKEWIYAWAKALEDTGDIRLLQIFNELKAKEKQ